MVDLKSSLAAAGAVAICAAVFAGPVLGQSREERIAERLQPVGEVCLQGDACAAGAGATVGAASSAPASATEGQEFSVEQAYQQNCSVCHNSGMAGAPKLDDAEEWNKRAEEKGLAQLVQNAITGINAMPPRGMCMTCSDENLAELVSYLSGHEE